VDLKFMQLQPSELAKLTTLLVVADLAARRQAWVQHPQRVLHPGLVWFGAVAALLMLQPNLGTTLVLGATVFAVLFCAGVPVGPLARLGAAGGALAAWGALGTDYRRARLLAFLDPWADPANTGYQIIQSQVSLGSGGWFGVGLGEGRQKWGFLPEAHTDFIFAIIGEELGLLGAFFVVALFALVGVLGLRVAAQAADTYGRLLATGITTWFCVQAFVNVGAVIGILPITGVPLPFISFGSSAMLANMAAAGMLCNIARASRR
jgi:cell division protein FtsW